MALKLNSDARDYDGFFGGFDSFDVTADGTALNGMPFSGNLSIGPYTCVILSQG